MKQVLTDVLSMASDFREWVYRRLLSSHANGLRRVLRNPGKEKSCPVFSIAIGGRLWEGGEDYLRGKFSSSHLPHSDKQRSSWASLSVSLLPADSGNMTVRYWLSIDRPWRQPWTSLWSTACPRCQAAPSWPMWWTLIQTTTIPRAIHKG